MQRHAIGIIAIVLLLGAAAFLIWPPQGAEWEQLNAACSRVGALMAVLWLAYPKLKRLPAWILPTIPVILVVLAWRPRLIPIVVPIIIALAILHPKSRSRRQL